MSRDLPHSGQQHDKVTGRETIMPMALKGDKSLM